MLVKTSLEYLATLDKESGADPALREELGEAYRKVGDVQGGDLGPNIGDHKGAARSYTRSIELLEPLAAARPPRPRARVSLAKAYLQQGQLSLYTDGAAAALPMLLKAVEQGEAAKADFEKEVEGVSHLGDAYNAAADVLATLGRVPEAMATLDRMIAVAEEYALAHPDEERTHEVLTGAYGNAAALTDDEMPVDAYMARVVPLFQKAIESHERLIALKPDNLSYRWSMAETRFNYADALYDNGDYTGAITLLRQASAVFHAQANDPNDARAQFIRAFVDSTLARSLYKTQALDEAESIFIAAESRLKALEKQGDTLRIQFALTKNETYHGLLLIERGHWREAHRILSEGIARGYQVHAKYPLTGANRIMLDEAEAGLERVKRELSRGR
jgi:tetratricopeptide (TPR) repeat protein